MSTPSTPSTPVQTPPHSGPGLRARLAAALAQHRHELALGLVKTLEGWDKYTQALAACQGDYAEFARVELYAFVDYLALFFRTGDETYLQLFIGEKLRQAYDPKATPDQQQQRKVALAAGDTRVFLETLRGKAAIDDMAALEVALREITRLVTFTGQRTASLLLIGDCLHIDIVSFLTAAAAEDAITLQPTYISAKNPVQLREAIVAQGERRFDAVFYSPYSYAQSLELMPLQNWRSGTRNARWIMGMVDAATTDTANTLDLVARLFECPVFVHNTAQIRRHDGSAAELLKNLITRRPRRLARETLNRRIADHIQRSNAATFPHVFLVDEAAILARHGERELGRRFYYSELQHPAVLGRWLAQEYRDLIAAQLLLNGKKVIACDLDNTLWNGVIGEGAVEHLGERQRVLKALRHKGVVLTIVSKNDPHNVRWNGGVLGEEDFVQPQINWEPKVVNLQRLQKSLNLKLKDFVFIDDRADEREMVRMALPQVHAMDATQPRTWRLLETWCRLAVDDGESDRTRLYKDRDRREQFIEAQPAQEDSAQLFAKLDLRLEIRDARASELKRVAELINRTNQFNLCGTRTTLREVTAWHRDERRRILVADAADKFGPMGLIAVMVLHLANERLEIPAFVLSCRVFGYGIERALVNAVKRLSGGLAGGLPIAGLYTETLSNEPCRQVYKESGFTWDGTVWLSGPPGPPGSPAPVEDAPWLTIKAQVAPLPQPAMRDQCVNQR